MPHPAGERIRYFVLTAVQTTRGEEEQLGNGLDVEKGFGMNFDLRTCDAAYYFVLKFMDMTPDKFITELVINCDDNFETFWNRNIEHIRSVNISGLKIMAFHVAGSLDCCQEIKTNGLLNLQKVLSAETTLKQLLERYGVTFDIQNKTVSYHRNIYNIDYEKYRHRHFLTGLDEALSHIAYRVYYDFCVNGFMVNDNIYDYGTDIHERPEFLLTLGKVFPQVQKLDEFWRRTAKSYRIDFFVTVNQVHRFNFELDEFRDPPFEDWQDLDDELKLKKWMLSHAIGRARDTLGMMFMYIKDDVTVPPNQIISISEIQKPPSQP